MGLPQAITTVLLYILFYSCDPYAHMCRLVAKQVMAAKQARERHPKGGAVTAATLTTAVRTKLEIQQNKKRQCNMNRHGSAWVSIGQHGLELETI